MAGDMGEYPFLATSPFYLRPSVRASGIIELAGMPRLLHTSVTLGRVDTDITKNQHTKTAVIADDHQVFRDGTRQILEAMENVSIVAEASDGLAAITAVRKYKPDIVILDAAMPMARGIEVYGEARRWSPETKVLLLTGFTSAGFISDWLQAGVDGILLKSCDSAEIALGIKTVLESGNFVAKAVMEILKAAKLAPELTVREREVLALVVSGSSNADIADKLSISSRTVEKHRGSLMQKLNVGSVAELMVYALREGLLEEFRQL